MPNLNYVGSDSFKYKVCNSSTNECETASVNIVTNSTIDNCDALASGNLDTDGDGVSDICDLDDDNDGILDTDECPVVTPFLFKLNDNNKTFKSSGRSGDIGDTMLYKNVGTSFGVIIDLKITVTANSDPQNMTIDISGFKYGSDLYPILLGGTNTKEIPSATVKFEFFKSNTDQLVNVAPSFLFKDIDHLSDGTGESLEIDNNLVSSYSLSKNPSTDLYIVDNISTNYTGASGNFLRVNSKKEESSLNSENLWLGLQLLEVNSFNINILKRTGNTGYVFESDTFSNSTTTYQLDADCSIDTDNDGIPDYLDTDSDNDGCPDATEAEKNMQTTATLSGGSKGGSSANLGTVSNKNGIPIPFGTANGSEIEGQKITSATKTFEKIIINTTEFTLTKNKEENATLTIDASAVKTNTFTDGVANYEDPNGTDTSNLLTYKWYKNSDPSKTLSTDATYLAKKVNLSNKGDYTVVITGANSSCSEEVTFTLNVNDTPTASNDNLTVNEDSTNNSLNILTNDSFGGDGANSGTISITSITTSENGTVSVDNNATPSNPLDDKITYTPLADFSGSDSFTYTITDADGDTSTATVTVNVTSINDVPTSVADTVTINEDSTNNSINVLDNDSFGGDGANSGAISIASTTSNQGGTVSVDNNATPTNPLDDKIIYTPLTNFNGADTFSYNITDADGDISSAEVTITVTSINDLPTATADTITVNEDSATNYINVLNNDDFGGDGANSGAISLVAATSNNGGTLTINNNNTPNNPNDDGVLYTPVANFNGTDTFSYSITDANGDVSTAQVTVTVTSVNDKPNATEDVVSVDEDSTNNSFNVLANDSFGGDGANNSAITINSATSNQGGTVAVDNNETPNDPTDDKITYSPLANFNGTDVIKYTITDANGDTSTVKIKITVNSINDTPSAIADTITVNEDSTNNTISVLSNDSFGGDGANTGTITLSDEVSTNGGTISVNNNGTSSDPTDDSITYTPAKDFNGADTFNYTITDKNGDISTAQVTVTVTSVNDTPASVADTKSVDEDSTNNSFDVLANDSFGGDGANSGAITIASSTSAENGTVTVDNNSTPSNPLDDKITYTPFANFNGSDSFTYTITDADGDTSTATVTVNVSSTNDTPSSAADTATVNEDSTNNSIDVLNNDNFGGDGANSGAISITSTTTSKGGTIEVDKNATPTNPLDDKIIYTPLANFNGTDTFSYSITDANGDISTSEVTVTVTSINDLPTATADTITVNEDTTSNYINVLINDDFSGDGTNTGAISLVTTTSNNAGTLTINNNNTPNNPSDDGVLYTPAANFNGTDTFSYSITDANGDISTAQVTVTVTPVNDLPSATKDTYTVNEDSSNNNFSILDNDDFGGDGPNNGSISVTSTTSTQGGTVLINDNDTSQDPTDDTIIYTPIANFNGTDVIEYSITDANGDISTAEITITVNSVNDMPNAVLDTITVNEDTTNNTVYVLSNDSFGGDGANTGTITLSNETSTKKGIITINNNGTPNDPTDDSITYIPAKDFNGTDTFSYTITDKNGDTSSAEVTVTVNSVDDLPLASNDTTSVNEDSANNTINVINNDSFGGDGPNTGTIAIISTTSAENGTVAVDDNATPTNPLDDKITYTPFENFFGVDTFTYTITDADGDSSNATVTVNVNSVNDTPTSVADTATVDEDTTNNTINVTSNDNFGGDGPNSGTISIIFDTTSKGGTIAVDNNETPTNPQDDKIIYIPLANFNGTDTFSYTITDANGDISSSQVTVTVTSINDVPTATADTVTVDEDSTTNYINVLENDNFGGDGANSGTISLVTTVSNNNGSLTINNNNTPNNPSDDGILYTPATNFNGSDTFSYSITDANGDVSTAEVTVTVTSINDLPKTTYDTVTINEDSTSNSFDVLVNDSFGGDGPNNGSIVIASSTTNQGGSVTIDNNGTENNPTDDKIIYTPIAGSTGSDSFEYTITDANGDTSSATVNITINASGVKYNPTAAADCFNIFVQNNLTVANGDTAGSIAAGGNLTYNENYSITSEDCGCFSVNDVNIGMLIGGKVSYPETGIFTITNENQYIKIGEENNTTAWYQNPDNTYSPIRITPQDNYEANAYIQLASNSTSLDVSNSKNPVFENNIIDFDMAFQQLQTNAISMSKETNNASVLNTDYEAISNNNLPSEIVIGLNNGINYLNITAEDLNNVTSVEFYDQPNSSRVLIINVNTTESFDWNVWEQKNLDEESNAYILYNFYNSSTLNILNSNTIQGTILAPFADINKTVNKANIAGQIIGKSLNIDGGEVNCDVFDAQVYSPKDANTSPIAEFTSDKENDCLVDNKFTFTNNSNTGTNSQPTEPISYSWDFGDGSSSIFMNPSKTYSKAGVYDVKLTATNKYGSTDKTIQIEITTTADIDVTESNSTVDEDAGSVTKEFTLNNDTDYTSYSWSLSNVGENLHLNEKVVSFEFTEEGEYDLTVTVINNNCSNTKIIPITITSDEVSTGNDGGLESESLGDAISIRYFKRKVKSVPTIFKKTRDIIYNKKNLQKN
ncbi:Ig-like domain-containing protein [Polaribacter sp. MSW5]|uniref:Ig-like domain-containing protein n=1 Tax=Polaribacter ponticola TaxID=2978475 RepID=A0ABT5S8Y0_9FLAO|nr:Ig-like domain-containing protein [Polaribacter sp. MSW5]MDD7914578.1 Ig-like domain-containing protein [Polaribacter sp. MSW5]